MGLRRTFICLLSSVFIAAACAPGGPSSTSPAVTVETVRFGGSGAGYPAIRVLADAYVRAHPGVRLEFVASSSASSGVLALREGALDVAVLARALTTQESDESIKYVAIARDAVAVVVNPTVGLVDLSTAQLRDLYAGKTQNWRELGVAGDEITLLDRPEDETAKIALRLVIGTDVVTPMTAVVLAKEPDMVKAVEKTAGAVGFFSASLLTATPSIGRAIRIDGVAPDVAAIRAGAYLAVRVVGIAVSRSSADRAPLAGFIEYLGSRAASDVLTAAGFAPLR